MLLCPQIPMLFMGEETGSRSPFLFFTDFHDELADAVRDGPARQEFSPLLRLLGPRGPGANPPIPTIPATFAASVPQEGPEAAHWLSFYRELIALRHRHIVPRLKVGAGAGRAPGRWATRRSLPNWRMRRRLDASRSPSILARAAVVFPEPEGEIPSSPSGGGRNTPRELYRLEQPMTRPLHHPRPHSRSADRLGGRHRRGPGA